MKSKIMILLMLIILASCNCKEKNKYTLTYKIHYSDRVVTNTVSNEEGFRYWSREGTNTILGAPGIILYKGTFPIEIISNKQEVIDLKTNQIVETYYNTKINNLNN